MGLDKVPIFCYNSYIKWEKNLIKGKRTNSPCDSCNAEGTILGINHAKKWAEIYGLENKNLFI